MLLIMKFYYFVDGFNTLIARLLKSNVDFKLNVLVCSHNPFMKHIAINNPGEHLVIDDDALCGSI